MNTKNKSMSKTITLSLSEAEYKELLQNYLLGSLIHGEVNQQSQAQMIFEAELLNKLNKAAYDQKIKGFKKLDEGLFGFPNKMEEAMINTYDDFIDYVESGERDQESEVIKKQIDDMRKQGLL